MTTNTDGTEPETWVLMESAERTPRLHILADLIKSTILASDASFDPSSFNRCVPGWKWKQDRVFELYELFVEEFRKSPIK